MAPQGLVPAEAALDLLGDARPARERLPLLLGLQRL